MTNKDIVPKQELKPWLALESGDVVWADFSPKEQDLIVKNYAPKIRYLALRLRAKLPKNTELNELISSGTLGLLEALGKYRAQLGIRFETYAESRIRGAMLDELRRLDWFPRSLRLKVRQIDEVMRNVENEHGRRATEEEIQLATGLELKDVRQGLEALQNHLCLSIDLVQDSVSFSDSLNDSEPYQNIVIKEMLEKIVPLIGALTPREKLVLSLYYTDGLNMREVAEVMEITEGRVSQLHTQALGRLRREFILQYGEAAY